MVNNFITFLKDKFILFNVIISLFFNTILWLMLILFIRRDEQLISLHYNIYYGVDKVGSSWQSYFLPLSAFATYLVNTIIAFYLNRRARFLSYFLVGAALLVQLLMLVSVGSIIYINL